PPQESTLSQAEASARPGEATRSILDSIRDLNELLADYAAPGPEDCETIARSPQMREVLELARRYASTRATVLIDGESGTGKERVARLVHHASDRALNPYVQVNCAALS